MKAIIQGFRYDTDKARLIGEAESEVARLSPQYWSAGLYVTPRSGRYFLAGEGHEMSVFSKLRGRHDWSEGEAIIPLEDREAAFNWAQQHLPVEVVEAEFDDMIEDA